MIRSFRHKELRRRYESNDVRGIGPQHLKRLRTILTRLDAANAPADMDLPGLRLHPLKGDLRGFYAVDVSGNWRVVFRFENEEPRDVDYGGYH